MSRSTLTGLNTSPSEREYVALGVELGMRGDGRGRLDYRSLSVQAGVLAQVRPLSVLGLNYPRMFAVREVGCALCFRTGIMVNVRPLPWFLLPSGLDRLLSRLFFGAVWHPISSAIEAPSQRRAWL